MTYRSLVDRWLVTVFAVSSGACAIALVAVLWSCFTHGITLGSLVTIPLVVAGGLVPWWIVMTTEYELTNRSLEIRSGPFHWSVSLREITSLEITRHPGSSPALSLDRLRIQHAGGALIMISPENREHFLGELRRRGVACEVRRP